MFAELVCQTNFSFLTGASEPEEMVSTAAFLGYQALAITDECSVAGVVRAYAEIRRNSLPIKLVVGSRFKLADSLEVVLLCPDKPAYAELCRIITNARRRSAKGEYQLAEWDLKSIRHCLVIWLPGTCRQTNTHWGQWLHRFLFSRSWIGASRLLDGLDEQRFAEIQFLEQTFSMPVMATSQALFHHSDRLPVQHVLHAIRCNTTVAELGLSSQANAERTLRPLNKLNKLYPRKWLEQSTVIASRCQFCLSQLKYQYPAEIIPAGYSARQFLRECVEAGILKRFGGEPEPAIRAIIEKELSLISEQHYEYFFLTIYDVVQFARRQHILYQGRGSAANSVVCYCLEITAVDPRQIDVLFERFISKERDEPPDIDVDFEHERREEVIQYIYNKYGRERTALAATVISFRFKSAFKAVGKALGFAESQLDYIVKNINRRDKVMPWKSQLADLGLDPTVLKVKQLVYLVEQIVGFPRHLSQHVGGFVISAGPLYELVPVENAAMAERTVIQWDKDDLETLGLLKVDVLALGMLTAIRKTFDIVNQHMDSTLSIAHITGLGDDRQVYDMICAADTVGVFQIESRAQMGMLPRLKPRKYYDLVVQIAIVRPGPIQGDMVHPYLKRRQHGETVNYPSAEVEKVLERTMGVPIFQEQVIQLAMVAAGFTGGEADQLRRAMASWKKNGRLNLFREKLVNGMLDKGYAPEFANTLFDQIKGFSGYGFPESHSASFAVLAYVSCWLKFYFPVEFYVGLLNSWPMGFYTPSQLVQDAQQHDIAVLPVCINASTWDHQMVFVEHQKAIRLGFRLVKGVSELNLNKLVSVRPTTGFSSVDEVKKQQLLRHNEISALASADAFKGLAGNRFQVRWNIMDGQSELPLFGQDTQTELFSLAPDNTENLIEDYASTGLSVSHHPIELIYQQPQFRRITLAKDLKQAPNQSVVHILGCVTCRQAPGTASGVTFLTLEDHTGNTNVVVWQSTARHQQQAFLKATILQVDGILERSPEGVIHVIAGKLTDCTDILEQLRVSARDFH
ncbi:error-prone DNA polymerase [Salinimonas sediminis]|uniref:Error-prone DNA polymerase n=1 Tax=Salinimonas sediminis TaxID=2303538 RepID=A0A346NRY8_9ALTE|nr:error-prone DNA polymerase [Salinimonas sediminis]AXR08295.1 DNA polymerase III subunit alpha [Salinimonas sediminis]